MSRVPIHERPIHSEDDGSVMRIVVTGGAGFIGMHVVAALLDAGHDVVVIDSLDPAAHRGVPAGLPHGADYRWVDVTDQRGVLAAVEGADAVDHHAARVGLGVDFNDVRDYVTANDVGTSVLLWALHATCFTGRLVVASSMVVYGEGGYECAEHGPVRPLARQVADLDAGRYEPTCPLCGHSLSPCLVSEDAPTDPRNIYAATKLHQEHLCAAYGREHGIAVTALRYHNVYGSGMPRDTPYAGVASIFRSQIAAGGPPRVMEDGGQRRDFVAVRDVARANVHALTAPAPYDGSLNIASGRVRTVLDMARTLAGAHGSALEPVVVGGYRLGDVRHVTADPTRAVAAIGFRAAVEPEEGLASFATAPLRLTAPQSA
jgi:dTDP-L-rhamnose 4-epimerase